MTNKHLSSYKYYYLIYLYQQKSLEPTKIRPQGYLGEKKWLAKTAPKFAVHLIFDD